MGTLRGACCRCGAHANSKEQNMARKPGTRANGDFVLFDVFYENGTQRSNRRVPAGAVEALDSEAAARAALEQQDREIAERSGVPPLRIKTIRRAGK
jgi:hypothetical protein